MEKYVKPWKLPSMKFCNISYKDMTELSEEQKRKMDKIVKAAKETHNFYESFTRHREKEKESDSETLLVFNKRLFTSHTSAVVITNEARKIMARNAADGNEDFSRTLSRTELRAMKSVVDGLKLIHKGQDHVKDALSSVVTYETFNKHEYVTKSADESESSCYYVLNGAVEVTYDMNCGKSRCVYQPNILYNHGTGEYIGLVSPEGAEDDLSPPATIYTREDSQFIRINRNKFHEVVEHIVEVLSQEKRRFLSSNKCKLSIPSEIIEKIIGKLTKQEYPCNKVLIHQGEMSDEMFLIASGRCRLSREITLPDTQKTVKFVVLIHDTGDFFGEECILDRNASYCQAVTTTPTICYKLHRSALEIVQRECLRNLISQSRNEYPDDRELFEKGRNSCVWNSYKHRQIKTSLEEQGKLQYLHVSNSKRVRYKSLSSDNLYRENMYRFMENGGRYKPICRRAQSAVTVNTSKQHELPPRATTVLGTLTSDVGENSFLDVENDGSDVKGSVEKRDEMLTVKFPTEVSTLLERQVPKERLRKIIKKGNTEPDSKELVKLLSENVDLGRQLKMAWEDHEKENTGFTKTGVLATMTTEDIVRKAKALAEKQSTNIHSNEASDDDDDDRWNTVLHEENRNAKIHIAANRYRVAVLKRKMNTLARRKQKESSTNITPNQGTSQDLSKASPPIQFALTRTARSSEENKQIPESSLQRDEMPNINPYQHKTGDRLSLAKEPCVFNSRPTTSSCEARRHRRVSFDNDIKKGPPSPSAGTVHVNLRKNPCSRMNTPVEKNKNPQVTPSVRIEINKDSLTTSSSISSTDYRRRHHSFSSSLTQEKPERPRTCTGVRHRSISCLMNRKYNTELSTSKHILKS
ncbi:hypothetical protein SNE40_015017 [Patella caerulea]|uniref:Cyclic nucleotide-binding domain-containing protein n=1 Tax=Patella caerulea TaxID=87958 RepID=A0AAN8JMC7_PATCE